MLIKTKNEEYIFYKYLSLVIPKHFENKLDEYFFKSDDEFLKDYNNTTFTINERQIKKYIANLESITLGLTQNCNLRCKYCVYGGSYNYYRTHNNKKMSINTMKKSIDFFFSVVNSPLRVNKKKLAIAFYGGEPLLEFETIQECINYTKNLIKQNNDLFNVQFLMTSNGVLLNPGVIYKLVIENCRIDISMDGPEEEHDKFRLKKSGNGSFIEILKNIEYFKHNYEEHYSWAVRFFFTIHPFHDVKKIENFLYSRPDLFNEKNVVISWVGLKNLPNHILKPLQKAKIEQEQKISCELDKSRWFYNKITTSWLNSLFENPTKILAGKSIFTGSCYPSAERLFVDTDGNIHICERINSHFPIGSVYNGFNYPKIKRIIYSWHNQISKAKCWNCELWWMCIFCLANCSNNQKFIINKFECEQFIKGSYSPLKEFLEILEADDEKKNHDCYSNIHKYIDSL